MEIRLGLRWWVGEKAGDELPADLIRLLDGIARGGNLRYAARDAALSYRHAWGLVKHWEQRLGVTLVALEQGRGSTLTRAGEALRDIWHSTQERTAVALAEAALRVSRQLQSLQAQPAAARPVFSASHGFGLTTLAALMREAKLELELHFVGSEEALKRYAAGECQAAGFHLPTGPLGRMLWARFQRHLEPRRDVLLLVETRELGFMTRPECGAVSIRDLAAGTLRFQNRQTGSGSRLVFDLLLQQAGIAPAEVPGYHDEEYTHSAVAAMIASGAADVGFGVRAAAEVQRLAFHPEVNEKYLLAVAREDLARKPLALIPRLLSGQVYKRRLNETPGNDARASGKQLEIKHVPILIRPPRPVRRSSA
jgi:molybdate transport repressor ModE-like protein